MTNEVGVPARPTPDGRTERAEPVDRGTPLRFVLFLGVFLAIVGVILATGTLLPGSVLIAPPYAVTAYLMVFDRGQRYARPRNIVVSYLFVLASSEVFAVALGVTILALLLNVLTVSVFISFTPFSHPPALALTIFSYLFHDPLRFTVESLLVLLLVAAADIAFDRIRWFRERLNPPPSRSPA